MRDAPARCAICGEAIDPPVSTYNASDDPVHESCFGEAIATLGEVFDL